MIRSPSDARSKKKTDPVSIEDSLRKFSDLPEKTRDQMRSLRDAEGQLVWYRADFIRDTCERAGPSFLMICYSIIAQDLGRSIAAVRSDRLIAQLFDSATREEFGALSVSYFRAASMYQRNPRAVLELVALSADKRSGRFCTVEKAYRIAKELRERDEGKEPDPPLIVIERSLDHVSADLRKIVAIDAPISRAIRVRLRSIADSVDELLADVSGIASDEKGLRK